MQFKKAIDFILDKLAKELPAHLTYHNVGHTRDVYQAAEQIGRAEGITAADMDLLLTAVAYHDSGFLKLVHGHEDESCHIVETTLPGFEYNAGQIEIIKGIIMATHIPQLPHTHLEEIIADADLDYLGRDDFFTIGETLYKEFLTAGVVKTEDDWNRLQVRFMESHHYFTKTSVNLRKAKKEQNLKAVKAKLNH